MNTKQSQITITKHNDSLLIDISINTQIVLPKALTINIFFNDIKDLVFFLLRGKKDTGMHSVLQGIRETRFLAG